MKARIKYILYNGMVVYGFKQIYICIPNSPFNSLSTTILCILDGYYVFIYIYHEFVFFFFSIFCVKKIEKSPSQENRLNVLILDYWRNSECLIFFSHGCTFNGIIVPFTFSLNEKSQEEALIWTKRYQLNYLKYVSIVLSYFHRHEHTHTSRIIKIHSGFSLNVETENIISWGHIFFFIISFCRKFILLHLLRFSFLHTKFHGML